ncbi:hypothetical protein [Bradyrhizobium sp. SEMIA]|uniref:hypothetical protein n=1 Tax=Bradyrhizobium sp. SEMIA TaxID=2597515 RepID=UPI00223FE3CE|nr:hypothetical protein [Bradyrhizobium sp. SEMIA]
MITRRMAMASLAALLLPATARSAPNEQFSVAAGNESLPVLRYAAKVTGKRPAVILLHGSRGIELRDAPMSAMRMRCRPEASTPISCAT